MTRNEELMKAIRTREVLRVKFESALSAADDNKDNPTTRKALMDIAVAMRGALSSAEEKVFHLKRQIAKDKEVAA